MSRLVNDSISNVRLVACKSEFTGIILYIIISLCSLESFRETFAFFMIFRFILRTDFENVMFTEFTSLVKHLGQFP